MAELTDTYPSAICGPCGRQHGKPHGWAVSCWTGECGWCGQTTTVCSPRDYRYPPAPPAGLLALKEGSDG